MKTDENKSEATAYLKLADLLEYFKMDQQMTVTENNNIIYQRTVNDIPIRLSIRQLYQRIKAFKWMMHH